MLQLLLLWLLQLLTLIVADVVAVGSAPDLVADVVVAVAAVTVGA